MAELQRNELAQKFNCAPSQINYVLTTRFRRTGDIFTQSRRGGGDIRVIRLNIDKCDYVSQVIEQNLRHGINMRQATELIEGLVQTGLIGNGMKMCCLQRFRQSAYCRAGTKE